SCPPYEENEARNKARCADSASPYWSPRPLSSIVEPSMSLNSIVIVPVGNPPMSPIINLRGCLVLVLDRDQQQAAGQRGRGGQAVGQQPARDRVITHGPEQQAVGPGQVAGGVDGPVGEQVVDRGQVAVDGQFGCRFEGL